MTQTKNDIIRNSIDYSGTGTAVLIVGKHRDWNTVLSGRYACPECGRLRDLACGSVVSYFYHDRARQEFMADIRFSEESAVCPFCGHISGDECDGDKTFKRMERTTAIILKDHVKNPVTRSFYTGYSLSSDEHDAFCSIMIMTETLEQDRVVRKERESHVIRFSKTTGRTTELKSGTDISLNVDFIIKNYSHSLDIGEYLKKWISKDYVLKNQWETWYPETAMRFLFFHGNNDMINDFVSLTNIFLHKNSYSKFSEKTYSRFSSVIIKLMDTPEEERPGFVFGDRAVPDELRKLTKKAPLAGYLYLPIIEAGIDNETVAYIAKNHDTFFKNATEAGVATRKIVMIKIGDKAIPYRYMDADSAFRLFGKGYNLRSFAGKKSFRGFCRMLAENGCGSALKLLADPGPDADTDAISEMFMDYIKADILDYQKGSSLQTHTKAFVNGIQKSTVSDSLCPYGYSAWAASLLDGRENGFSFSVVKDYKDAYLHSDRTTRPGPVCHIVRITDKDDKTEGYIAVDTPLSKEGFCIKNFLTEKGAFSMNSLRAVSKWASAKKLTLPWDGFMHVINDAYVLETRGILRESQNGVKSYNESPYRFLG